jgi:ATP-binding cassette subfamily F protein 3
MTSRIALLGPNGIGKTTLINIIIEKVKLIQGDFYKDQKARIAHFSQHHVENLDLILSPLQQFQKLFP